MGRTPCCDKTGLKKGPWTPEEDLKLSDYIRDHGAGNWRTLPKNAGLQRCGKSCRLRWTNYLRPDIKRGRFSFEEEETIIQLHSILGNKWSAIAARLPGRTDNEIKNYWNTHIRKRLIKNGIDPITHTPRLDLLDLSSILTSGLCNNPSMFLQNNILHSNLLGTQSIFNPMELLKTISTYLSLKQQNPDFLLQFLQQKNNSESQNQFYDSIYRFQNQSVEPPFVINQPNIQNSGYQYHEETSMDRRIPSNLNENYVASQPSNYVPCGSNANINPNIVPVLSENPSSINVQPINDYVGGNEEEKFTLDSLLSTPVLSSATPLNSSSTFVNSGNEDEKESYCSSLFNFEIPEGLDISDFL